MKRILTCALALLLVSSLLIPTALADLIVPNPADNLNDYADEFCLENRDDCQIQGYDYLVNSPEGGTRVMESPKSREEVAVVQNGATFYIYLIWDGTPYGEGIWGYTPGMARGTSGGLLELAIWNQQNADSPKGWVRMDDLTLIVDYYKAFTQEHRSELYYDEEEVQAFIDRLTPGDELKFYTFPNSGRVSSTLPVESIESIEETIRSQNMLLYRDENSRVWSMRWNNFPVGWHDCVCLTDPTNPDIPASGIPEATYYPAKELPRRSNLATPVIAGILVAATAAISIVLLKRRKKS